MKFLQGFSCIFFKQNYHRKEKISSYSYWLINANKSNEVQVLLSSTGKNERRADERKDLKSKENTRWRVYWYFSRFFLQSILISPILNYILVPVCLVSFWINLGNFLLWSSFPSQIHFSIEMPTMHLLTCNSVVCDLQNFNKGRKLSTKLVLTEVNTVSNYCTQLFFIQELKMTVQFSRHCRFFCKWDEIKCSCYFESLHMIFFYSAGSVSHLTTLSVRKL